MTSYSWNAYAETAKANSGFGPTLPEGTDYVGEIIDAGCKVPKSGKPRFTWKFQVLTGPHAGETEIMGQTLTADNPKAVSAFVGQLKRLGINLTEVPDGTPPEAVAKLALGRSFTFDIVHRADGDNVYVDFKNVRRLEDEDVPAEEEQPSFDEPADDVESRIRAEVESRIRAEVEGNKGTDAPARKLPF